MYIFSKVNDRISFIIEIEMTENNKDRYQQLYKKALKSTVQREPCDLWNIVKEKEKKG